jgi:hypothetical protein
MVRKFEGADDSTKALYVSMEEKTCHIWGL